MQWNWNVQCPQRDKNCNYYQARNQLVYMLSLECLETPMSNWIKSNIMNRITNHISCKMELGLHPTAKPLEKLSHFISYFDHSLKCSKTEMHSSQSLVISLACKLQWT